MIIARSELMIAPAVVKYIKRKANDITTAKIDKLGLIFSEKRRINNNAVPVKIQNSIISIINIIHVSSSLFAIAYPIKYM